MSPDSRCARSAARRAASEPCCSMPTSSMFLRLHPQQAICTLRSDCSKSANGCAGGLGIEDTHGSASACLMESRLTAVVDADGSHLNPNHSLHLCHWKAARMWGVPRP